ncbi:MAG: hypothetical protein ACTSRW_01940 [Candidatus Helarchaeota archaeon]
MEITNTHLYKGRGALEPPINMKDYLYSIIKQKGPITRGELKELTNIPRTTLYDTIVKLIISNKLEKYSISSKKRGRPKVYYKAIS